jgi:hypothetical protein
MATAKTRKRTLSDEELRWYSNPRLRPLVQALNTLPGISAGAGSADGGRTSVLLDAASLADLFCVVFPLLNNRNWHLTAHATCERVFFALEGQRNAPAREISALAAEYDEVAQAEMTRAASTDREGPPNCITAYMHCKKCLLEMPHGVSPRDWQRVQVGWTPDGIQVWCLRHDCNVAYLDLSEPLPSPGEVAGCCPHCEGAHK